MNLTAIGGDSTFLSYFTIGVGNIGSMNTCYTVYDALPLGGNQTFTCSPQPVIGMIGRYVSVTKFGGGVANRPDTIILCEVIVNGFVYTSTNVPY